MKAPRPPDEEKRLAALRRYQILDTVPEQEFDDITSLASRICNTPIAMISFIDENRQWFKSRVGMTESGTARDVAFCAHGILEPDVFVVEDAPADSRFAANPLVTGDPSIRFYAGAPLLTPDGHALGMLCVNDRVSRKLREDQTDSLRALSRLVVAQLELRRSRAELAADITGRNALELASVRLAAIVESSDDAIIGKDLSGIVTSWNAGAERIFGYSAPEMIGQPIARLIPPERRQEEAEILDRIRRGESLPPFDTVRQRKDGRAVDLSVAISAIKNSAGMIVGASKVARDITERKKAEEIVRQASVQLARFRRKQVGIELAILITATVSIYALAARLNWFEAVTGWVLAHEVQQLDATVLATMFIVAGLAVFAFRRWRETESELTSRQHVQSALGLLHDELNRRVAQRTGQLGDANRALRAEIADRKRAEDAVRDSERKLRQVIDGLGPNTFLGLLSMDGTLIEANRPGLVAAGLRPEDVLGKPFDETFWWSYSEAVRERLRDAMARAAAGEAFRFDVQVRVAGDALAWIDFCLNPVRDASGRVIYIVPSGIVIDERVKAEAAVQRLNCGLEQRVIERTAQLESANKELEAFSHSVSHDLRAPLRAMDGLSQAVIEDFGERLPAEGQHYLLTIRKGAQKMGLLIDNLLIFSQVSRAPLDRRNVNTDRLVRNVLDEFSSEREGRRIDVRIGELPTCSGDAALLRQVWMNLLSNALKYTKNRASTVIEVGCAVGPEGNVYFVRDNGTGFDMRYVDKLFGVFQRLHRAEDYEGTGVGLAIVQRIIHRHGGRIWAESALDHGATFYFTLG